MLRFLRIERPTTATLRPVCTATSIACCIRWTFEANEATRTRPWRCGMIWRNASPTSRSEPVNPRRSAFVESHEQQVDAAVAELGEPPDVGAEAVDRACGRASSRSCAARGPRRSRSRRRRCRAPSAPCARTRAGTARAATGSPSGSISRSSAALQQPVLVELRLDQPERQPRRPDLGHPHLAHAGTGARRRGPRAHA